MLIEPDSSAMSVCKFKLASICEKSSEEARDRADVLGICIADLYAKVSCYKSGLEIT